VDPILSQLEPVHALNPWFCKINFSIIFPCTPSPPKVGSSFQVLRLNFYAFPHLPMRVTCPANVLLHLMTPIVFHEGYRL